MSSKIIIESFEIFINKELNIIIQILKVFEYQDFHSLNYEIKILFIYNKN